MIWIVSPNNPTGMVVSASELRDVVEIARGTGTWVLHDAGHRGLEWDGGLAPAVVDLYERGVTTGGATKALGVTGLRVGWIVSRDKAFIAHCNTIQTYVTLCNSWPGEVLALKLLEPGTFRRVLETGKATGRQNRALFEAWLARRPDRVGWVRPEGGYLGFPGYRYPMGSWALCERALRHRVVLAPGTGFLTEGHVRIGFGIETPRFVEGLRRMDALLAELDGAREPTPVAPGGVDPEGGDPPLRVPSRGGSS
jgi:aspartate/methionine/tyrosine aminotransferase